VVVVVLDSERSKGAIDFTKMCVFSFFFVCAKRHYKRKKNPRKISSWVKSSQKKSSHFYVTAKANQIKIFVKKG